MASLLINRQVFQIGKELRKNDKYEHLKDGDTPPGEIDDLCAMLRKNNYSYVSLLRVIYRKGTEHMLLTENGDGGKTYLPAPGLASDKVNLMQAQSFSLSP